MINKKIEMPLAKLNSLDIQCDSITCVLSQAEELGYYAIGLGIIEDTSPNTMQKYILPSVLLSRNGTEDVDAVVIQVPENEGYFGLYEIINKPGEIIQFLKSNLKA
ncbi:MAG: hypothetical protein ABIH72_02945 [archaeon]